MEWNDDNWLYYTLPGQIKSIRDVIAKYVGANSSDSIVIIENSSDGYNSVTKSIKWNPGDIIL